MLQHFALITAITVLQHCSKLECLCSLQQQTPQIDSLTIVTYAVATHLPLRVATRAPPGKSLPVDAMRCNTRHLLNMIPSLHVATCSALSWEKPASRHDVVQHLPPFQM